MPARTGLAPLREDALRDLERLVRPVQRIAGLCDLLGAERRAMRFFAALAVRRPETDHRAAGDQRRPVAAAGPFDGGCDGFGIVAVDPAGRPSGGLEPCELVIRARQRRRAVDRDFVVVEQHDQAIEPEMAGQRDRLVAEALHQAAVACDHIGEVIDAVVAEARIHQPFGERHADCRGDALPERPGGGLDARRVAILGMSRRLRSPLPEGLELVRRHALVARQVQQRIQQHRAMAGGQHKTIAIRPRRVGRIEFEEPRKQNGSDVGHAHRHARMTRLRLLDGVDRQEADRVGHFRMRNIGAAFNAG